MNNQMLPIEKLFNIEKGALQSTKCTPGDYDFITAAEDWKTHNEYSHECEALIFAAAASGSLGRTHYVDGKFITSDLCYILTPKNEEEYPLNLNFYHFVFNSLRPVLVAATKSGTSKESINQRNFKSYEIPYFDIELQDFWIDKLKNTLNLKNVLDSELTCQQTLLKKLRQQILQEAIEGKLTTDWRAQNPDVELASELLKRIAAEKAQLVKEKKIKAQKPLPPITGKEKPFELPQGWEWCRIDDMLENKIHALKAGPFGSSLTKAMYCSAGYKVYGQEQVIKQNPNYGDYYVNQEKYDELYPCKVAPGDILISLVGTIGKLLILPDRIEQGVINPRLIKISLHKSIYATYFDKLYSSNIVQKQLKDNASGQTMDVISIKILKSVCFPLPPVQEQQVIVTKVEKLLALCDQLEAQISQNQIHAEQLMQTVLGEAFGHNSETEFASVTLPTSTHLSDVMVCGD